MSLSLPPVLTLSEALERGFSRHAVKYRASQGRWQRVYPRVYVTYSGPVLIEHRLQAALAYAARGAALSHETAAVFQRLRVPAVKEIHLTLPATRRIGPQPGLKIHY